MAQIRMLGPLAVEVDGTSVVPSASKPRQVLAVLAAYGGKVVTVPTLLEELWGDEAPRTAGTALQTYVAQVRRMVTAAVERAGVRSARDVLATHGGGYRLSVEPDSSDAARFRRLAQAGHQAADRGEDETASALLREGLELWRGGVLEDVPVGRILELEALGLEEARMTALERRFEVDLRMGRSCELVGELRVLTSRHPMHENLCAQLMVAHVRSGNTWRALEAYGTLRETLRRELGIDPGTRVQRLHQAILRGDPEPAGMVAGY